PAVCLTLGLMCMVLTGVGVMGRTLGSQGLVSSLVDMVYAVSLLGCAMSQLFFAQDEELESVARLHGELNSVATVQDALFSSYLPFYLLPPLGGTALATCGFLYGAFSSNFMSLVPQIFIIFMPLCLCGDDLQQTSGETLSLCGYSGNWLDWPPRARRLLHCVMARGTRPQLVYVKAFGHLDRKACLSVLKTWFSFLQTLTNLSGISPDGH
ncbi:Odorant receptor 42, partial [Frankliniella occidentalis]